MSLASHLESHRHDPIPYSNTPTRCAGLFALTLLFACSAPSAPALRVGDLIWAEDELLGLSEARRLQLAELAALGLALSNDNALAVLDPAIQVDLESAWITQAALEANVRELGADDEQLRVAYQAEPEWELTVRHVLFFSERYQADEHRAEARRRADAAMVRLENGEDFPIVAAELSEEPGAAGRQGLLDPGREGDWVREFWSAATALEVGEISPVTETRYGFHVLRLDARDIVPFAQARSNLVRRLASLGSSVDAVRAQWLVALESEIQVDEDAIVSFVDDPRPSGRILANWPENFLDDDMFFRYLAEDPEADARVAEGDVDVVRDILLQLTRLRLATARAEDMGVELPSSEEARIYRDWDNTLFQWTAALGFQPESSRAVTKLAARAALEKTGQAARIARTEIRMFGSILLGFYSVSLAEGGD